MRAGLNSQSASGIIGKLAAPSLIPRLIITQHGTIYHTDLLIATETATRPASTTSNSVSLCLSLPRLATTAPHRTSPPPAIIEHSGYQSVSLSYRPSTRVYYRVTNCYFVLASRPIAYLSSLRSVSCRSDASATPCTPPHRTVPYCVSFGHFFVSSLTSSMSASMLQLPVLPSCNSAAQS